MSRVHEAFARRHLCLDGCRKPFQLVKTRAFLFRKQSSCRQFTCRQHSTKPNVPARSPVSLRPSVTGSHQLFAIVLMLGLAGCFPGKPVATLEVAANGAYSASLSQQGDALLVGSFQHGGSFWNIVDNARLYNWNHRSGYLTEILYSDIADDGTVAITANYYNLVLWDTASGEAVWFWSSPSRIESVDLSADGRYALLGLYANKAILVDVQQGNILREFDHQAPVSAVAMNLVSGHFLTGSEDRTATLWNLASEDPVRRFNFDNQVSLVAFNDEGSIALMVPANEAAELWNLAARQKIANLKTANFRLYSAHFTAGGRLIVGTTHRNLMEFDLRDGSKVNSWQIGTESRQAFRSAIVLDVSSRGSTIVAVGSNGYLYRF